MSPRSTDRRRFGRALALLALAVPLSAQDPAPEATPEQDVVPDEEVLDEEELDAFTEVSFDFDMGDMSIEELMNIDVTIASRSEQSLAEVPAAVYVLTGDEIRRAGHSSIPEALRMVPGFYVSRWSHVAWDVTSRGFGTGLALTNLAYLNQLLVLIDGVVVYSPLFAGVWWPVQDVDIPDVDRIEIVRGPGGVLWGSNAVHGVVHIITKKASDTQGLRVTLRNGNDDRHGSIRWGGRIGENGHFRAWLDGADYDTLHNPYLDIESDWALGTLGFRGDWKTASGRDLTLWGRTYEGDFDEIAFDLTTFVPFKGDGSKDGRTLFASLADQEEGWRVQAWWSRDRQDYPTFADIDIDTIDLEYLRDESLSENNRFTWGIGYRRVDSELSGDDPFYLDFAPTTVIQDNFRAFAIDTIDVPDSNLQFVLGAQFEHTEFTGFEVQPSVRALWGPNEDLNLWAGVSRPVRTPSLEERTLSVDSVFVGNPNFESENALIYELGARRQLGESAGVDLAFYYNDYESLMIEEPDPVTGQLLLTNDGEGRAYGSELALDAKPNDDWSLRTAYSYFVGKFQNIDGTGDGTDNQSPKHAFNLRSYYDLGENWELDGAFYLVESMGTGFEQTEYERVDLRVGYRPSEQVRLSAGVQQLNDSIHSELDEFDNVRRQFIFQVDWTP